MTAIMSKVGRVCWAVTLATVYTACFTNWPTITFVTFALLSTSSIWEDRK